MDRIKRISTELLANYPNRFGVDFDENKKNIKEIAIVRSKVLRNKVAGYITSYLRKKAAIAKAHLPSEEEEVEVEEQTESEKLEEG
jgi:small subunit ribosomal protein S17e